MSRKQDFINVLKGETETPVPYSVKFTIEAKENWKNHLGREFDPVEDTGSYVVASHTNNGWEEVKPGFWKDYFGVVWDKTKDKTLGVVAENTFTEPSFGSYEFPDPEQIPVYGFIRDNNEKYPDCFHMVSIGFTLFERAWSLTGITDFMMWMITEKNFVFDLLEKITEYNITVIENAAGLGVDCVHFGDDWGTQLGLMISPDLWKEMIKPCFKKTCQAARDADLLISLHSCGNVVELIPEMIDCGVDVFDPFQPEAMDIYQVYESFKGQISFWGGLSVQQTLPHGTPEDVREEGEKLLNVMGKNGNYILAPSHSLSGDVPVENIQAFLELAQNQ